MLSSPDGSLPTPLPDSWWKQDATLRIQGNIGVADNGEPLEIYFGVDDDNRPCAHGSLVAMTGAGKTALFHTLITSLVMRYSPSELRLVLMDGKMGVSFNMYRNLPHAEIISLNTPPSLGRSLLVELVDEMSARNALFKKHGVEHFTAYRNAGSPGGLLPRMLFIADEYQILFEDDDDRQAVQTLLKISEQARSAGIHMLLGSQHPAPAQMSHRDLVFSNFHLRMTMKVPQSDLNAWYDLSPASRNLVARVCTHTGRIVVNSHAGDDTKDIAGTVNKVDDEQQRNLLELLAKQTSSSPIILDSDQPPLFSGSPVKNILLDKNVWDQPHELERLMRTSIRDGGLGPIEWHNKDHSLLLSLGRQFNVRGQAQVVMTRKRNEHLCIVGERADERTMMMLTSLLASCLQLPPSKLELLIADRGNQDNASSEALKGLSAHAKESDYIVKYTSTEYGTEKLIKLAYNDLRWRRHVRIARREQLPTLVLVINEPDTINSLRLRPEDYGEPTTITAKILHELIDKGPAYGIHLLLGFESVEGAKSIMQPTVLQTKFRHKVALQMSEDDSYDFLGNFKASSLHAENGRSPAAMVYDTQLNHSTAFSPYSFQSMEIAEDMASIFSQLRVRPHVLPGHSFLQKFHHLLPPPASLTKTKNLL